jgi:hypothetical protein
MLADDEEYRFGGTLRLARTEQGCGVELQCRARSSPTQRWARGCR